MDIHYKGLIHERFEDAPWVGTLWIAPDCKNNCKGCHNQHLIDSPTIIDTAEYIVSQIVENPFSEGIILAGLDPLTYQDELVYLIRESLKKSLKIILYTGASSEEELLSICPQLSEFKGRGILVKYGKYIEDLRVHDYYSYGVLLSTSNQYIDLL